MINQVCKISKLEMVNNDTFMLSVCMDEVPRAGQFVMLRKVDGRNDPFLSRPISVFDWNNGELKLLIKILGRGTKLLSQLGSGEFVRIVGYGGNYFPDTKGVLLLCGGGIGIAPLYFAAKMSKSVKKKFVLGFRSKNDVILYDKFSELGEVVITTDDGSSGFKGNPAGYISNLDEEFDTVFTCGPMQMMNAIQRVAVNKKKKAFHSLEAVMGCGIKACLGCKIDLSGGSFHVCIDGPVFDGDVIFRRE